MQNNNKSKFTSDIATMHAKFGTTEVVKNLDKEKLAKFLEFRLKFLTEELNEAYLAFESSEDEWALKGNGESRAAAIVDALLDLVVVSLGTLDAFGVDADTSWDRIQYKNMQKVPGIKPERPNPLGLPDLIKPEGWTPPKHEDNVGLIAKIFE